VSPRSDPPPNLNSLTARINNVVAAQQRPLRRVQRVVANTVVGQMIPSGVVKGGTGIKLRVGEWASGRVAQPIHTRFRPVASGGG